MSEPELLEREMAAPQAQGAPANDRIIRHVLACVDASSIADVVLAHAAAVAAAAQAQLTVLRILEPSSGQLPVDPVEWTLRHRDLESDLREKISRFGDLKAQTVIDNGRAAERICAWAKDNVVDLTVLGRRGESNPSFGGLGATARRVAEVVNGSVLIVPSSQLGDAPIRYRRVLVPLDGSSRSESALPLGLWIGAAHDAETVLVHAAPNVDLTEANAPGAETITLRDQLRRHNERAGEQYLQQVRSRLPSTVAARIRVLPSGDPRHALARAAMDEHTDLMVLSCTGRSGHSDMAVGSAADYLINHMDIPVLLVRRHGSSSLMGSGKSGEAMAVRLPSRALT